GAGGLARVMREYSFGGGVQAFVVRFVLYFLSPIFQPLLGVLKALMSGQTFVIFEGLCSLALLLQLLLSRNLLAFMVRTLPFVVFMAAVSQFYHFRYHAIMYPVVLLSGLRGDAVHAAGAAGTAGGVVRWFRSV